MFPQKAAFRSLFISVAFMFLFLTGKSNNESVMLLSDSMAYVEITIDSSQAVFLQEQIKASSSDKRPNPILQLFKAKQRKNKKITAAILAFPFPFGIVGLHRIYLGTAPYVPVVYIGTLGGVFGILPFIDFCVLVLDKDISRYIENKKVMMWVTENKKPVK